MTEGGKGLLLLGGPEFEPVPGSHLADLVPLTIAGRRVRAVGDRFWGQLTPAGRVHPVMDLAEDVLDVENIWQDLPPFLGLNQFGPSKPGAAVLAVHPVLEIENTHVPMKALGIPDVFGESGGSDELMEKFGLNIENIIKAAHHVLERKD